MAVKGASVAYAVTGGLILYSGIKGSSLSDTARAVLSGNLSVTNTEPVSVAAPASGTDPAGTASSAAAGKGSANYLTIAKYLVSNGYSKAAAAGIVGCIAGESGGNPEEIGDQGTSFGLIQEHGSYSYLVTGNASSDLDKQMQGIIAYNNAQGSGLITMLNSISDPVSAARFYSEKFERPRVQDSDVVPSVASSTYAALNGAK